MIFLFSILLKKESESGTKVITYSTLLKKKNLLGKLTDVTGELSLVQNTDEVGFSLNALYQTYKTLLVGSRLAHEFGNSILAKFEFNDAEDPTSLNLTFVNEDGKEVITENQIEKIQGSKQLDGLFAGSSGIILCIQGTCKIEMKDGTPIPLNEGQVAFISPSKEPHYITANNSTFKTFIIK